jgi:deglycase
MSNTLQGEKIALLVADGFEQSELLEPRQDLDEAGAQDASRLAGRWQGKGLQSHRLATKCPSTCRLTLRILQV